MVSKEKEERTEEKKGKSLENGRSRQRMSEREKGHKEGRMHGSVEKCREEECIHDDM